MPRCWNYAGEDLPLQRFSASANYLAPASLQSRDIEAPGRALGRWCRDLSPRPTSEVADYDAGWGSGSVWSLTASCLAQWVPFLAQGFVIANSTTGMSAAGTVCSGIITVIHDPSGLQMAHFERHRSACAESLREARSHRHQQRYNCLSAMVSM